MNIRLSSTAALGALMVGAGTAAYAENDAAVEYVDVVVERIQVIGKSTERAKIPGAATRLNTEDLDNLKYQDILRTLRVVPGVNIQEEDGYGLRPNIGLRGSGVERSSKITLMEDGVLIAPASYAAPSAYYFPTAARMEAVEVRKGSAAVKFGPRSVGGALNLVSRSIPEEVGGFADVRLGSDDLLTLHGSVGGSGKYVSAMVEYYKSENDGFKQLPGGGDTGFDIEDVLGKIRVQTDEDAAIQQSLELKLSKTDSDSNETYLGLSDDDFAANPYQRYAASALDNIDTEHDQIQLTHRIAFGDVEVVTTAYRNQFERDWFKFNNVNVAAPDEATEFAWLRGDEDSPEGAIRLRHNARSYEAKGIQTLVAMPFQTGSIEHDLEFSIRYHEDYEDRLQYNELYTMTDGALVFSSETEIGSAGNRLVSANAWAFFMQDTITAGKWTIVPGVRYEVIELDRSDWASGDADRTGTENVRDTVKVNAFIPGLGVSYAMTDNLTLTGGVFKGFNPPGAGNPDAEEETSLNVELGAIFDQNGFYAEGMVFYSDYQNILGTCTAAVACTGASIGDQFNGGEARIWGLELLAGYTAALASGWEMPLSLNYTYTDAEFSTDFDDSFWGDVSEGDAFPYLSKHQLTASIGVASETFDAMLQANYVSASRTNAGTGAIPADEKVDGRIVLDASTHYRVMDNVELFATVQNLLDETYSVARRPIGLRPGKPRTVIGGVKLTF